MNVGPALYRLNNCILSNRARIRARVRKAALRMFEMNFESIIGLAASALLLVYLTYALLRPEKF